VNGLSALHETLHDQASLPANASWAAG
jgi:hypothetical protein